MTQDEATHTTNATLFCNYSIQVMIKRSRSLAKFLGTLLWNYHQTWVRNSPQGTTRARPITQMQARRHAITKYSGSSGRRLKMSRQWFYSPHLRHLLTVLRIKKAYRKKALELHPDRNYGSAEEATAKFAEVSSAYEVLSDPQERAWYDSHRDSILNGGGGEQEEHFEHNVRVTSAGALVALMSRFNSRTAFTDAPTGFFGILQETFVALAREEDAACDWEGIEGMDYPEFGSSNDGYEDVVKPFYRIWMNFSTKKSFSWRDQYRVSDGPDRAMRRLMEKENKRLRDEGIREFNDAVRSLVTFVRKRDPRYIPNTQSEADRQKIIRDAAIAQAAKSRAANKAKLDAHVTPAWAQAQRTQEDENYFSSDEESVVEHIECVVCNKIFKSEKQYEAHEKSKKHTKAVQQLQRQMRAENKNLNLDASSTTAKLNNLDLDSDRESDQHCEASADESEKEDSHSDVEEEMNENSAKVLASSINSVPTRTLSSESSDLESEYAPRKEVEGRLADALDEKGGLDGATAPVSVASEDADLPKLGKAKAKKAKKLARQEKAAQEAQVKSSPPFYGAH